MHTNNLVMVVLPKMHTDLSTRIVDNIFACNL